MAGGGCSRGGGGEEGVAVNLEDAVKLLVEHLVEPVLKSGGIRRAEPPTLEKQEAVARQVHAAVLLYNYYHRKQFPQLPFADPKRFIVSASLAAGDDLLMYLDHDGGDADASVTKRAFENACGIAEALDVNADSPPTLMWPISKVAVLLVDPTGKKCLIEYGSVTKGVWSIPERDIPAASQKSRGIELLAPDHEVPLSSEPYMLQQTAYSVVETKTGMKGASLSFLEEHLVYSLSKKETTAKLFILQYEQSVNSNLKEMPIEDLVNRMSGPLFRNEGFPETSPVVEYYHILPYKEVLLNLINRSRERSLDSSQSMPKEQPLHKGKSSSHSEIAESFKEQEANSKSNIKNTTTKSSDPKKNKGMKEVGNSGTNNCSTSKYRKNSNLNCRRKSEELKASPKKETGSLSNPDAETLKLVSNAANAEAKRAKSGGLVGMETNGQMDKSKSSGGFDSLRTSVHLDKNKAGNHSVSKNMAVDTIKLNAPEVDPTVKNHASENQIVTATEISGSINVNINDRIYASLQSLQKMRDDVVREHCMLGDRSAQFEMDIQTILAEGKMTPRVISILKKYEENSSNVMKVASSASSGEGSQTMKRKRLTEAVLSLSRSKCQELDEICRENNWILPRYTVLPSLVDGMYQATVCLVCPDLELNAVGGMKTTPREARDSAATAMLHQLHMKANEKLAELNSSTPEVVLLDKIPEILEASVRNT